MNINKYNLFINRNFDTYTFSNDSNNSIYSIANSNMVKNFVYIVLDNKPNNNIDYTNLNINSIITVYLFPTNSNNTSFSINEIIQTTDNKSIFIITNHIIDNLFSIKLLHSDNNTNYTLYNNTPSLIYNLNLESLYNEMNTSKISIINQKSNYTNILNSENKLSSFINSNISITTDYTTNYTINFLFNNINIYPQIISIIDKFYLNIQVYDYNDFKFIYNKDFSESSSNYTLTAQKNILGILKTVNTIIAPHKSYHLQYGNTYTYTDTIINKFTSFEKEYYGEKLFIIFQVTMKDKSIQSDISNNIESDYIYIIS